MKALSLLGVKIVSRAAFEDLNAAFQRKEAQARVAAMEHVTDLFVAGAPDFTEQHVVLFDHIIGLMTDAIEMRARARLAERLADIPNAPPGVIAKLAADEIGVARPVLARSVRLADADLITLAIQGGRDHMLAISERRMLSVAVTDVLVTTGDRVVINAVAGNPGATFSDKGFEALVSKSESDELLQSTLGRRSDIPSNHMAALFELAKKAAKERLMGDVSGASRRIIASAVSSSTRELAVETAARAQASRLAMDEVMALIQENAVNEETLLDFARHHAVDKSVAALAYLSKLPLQLVERGIAAGDHDFTLIVARSADLQWATVKALIVMRPEQRPGEREMEGFKESYARLNGPTAQRILRFLHARETANVRR